MINFRTKLLALALLAVPMPHSAAGAAEPTSTQSVRDLLLARDEEIKTDLLSEWLTPAGNADEKANRIEALSAELYASELRLLALGLDRKLIADQPLSELPAAVLEERANIRLDPYEPFANRTFTIP
jgi:hypothetical protein